MLTDHPLPRAVAGGQGHRPTPVNGLGGRVGTCLEPFPRKLKTAKPLPPRSPSLPPPTPSPTPTGPPIPAACTPGSRQKKPKDKEGTRPGGRQGDAGGHPAPAGAWCPAWLGLSRSPRDAWGTCPTAGVESWHPAEAPEELGRPQPQSRQWGAPRQEPTIPARLGSPWPHPSLASSCFP